MRQCGARFTHGRGRPCRQSPERAQVAPARDALRDAKEWIQCPPGLVGCRPRERANGEPHLVAVTVDDKRLLAADGMPWQGAVREPDPVRLLDDGHDLHWLNDGHAEQARRNDRAVAPRHRSL